MRFGRRRSALSLLTRTHSTKGGHRMESIIVRLGRSHFRSRITHSVRRWQVYELAKRHWDAEHPEASSAERDAAIVEIARKLGV